MVQELQQKRKELGLTQIEAAKRIGVSVNAYRNWEYGGARPTPENMDKLKAVFDEATNSLMTYLKEA